MVQGKFIIGGLILLGLALYSTRKSDNISSNALPSSSPVAQVSDMVEPIVNMVQEAIVPKPRVYTDQERYMAKFPVSNAVLARDALRRGTPLESLSSKLRDAYQRAVNKGIDSFP